MSSAECLASEVEIVTMSRPAQLPLHSRIIVFQPHGHSNSICRSNEHLRNPSLSGPGTSFEDSPKGRLIKIVVFENVRVCVNFAQVPEMWIANLSIASASG